MADKEINENVPSWQFNVIPGNANQGAILITRKPLTNPPFKMEDFVWINMEDIIGTADIKLEYDEVKNEYHLFKAKGHRDNEGNWTYTWELIGVWDALTDEVVEILKQLNYVEYVYDTSVPNTLTVYGINKDGTLELICNITFVTLVEFNNAINTLITSLNNEINRATAREDAISINLSNEITRATTRENEIDDDLTTEVSRAVNRENELENKIENKQVISGNATNVTQSSNGRIVDVNVDDDSIKVGSDNKLKADVLDDTQVRNDKGWSSAKISQVLVSGVRYQGQVPTYADLPTGLGENEKGYLYDVLDSGANYIWNGTGWDKQSENYIAGTGIDITGRVISATGIAFSVGNGLQTTGTGATATLSTKNGNGLEIDTNGANKVKGGNGIDVNANGVNVTTGDTTQIVSDKVEVKTNNGLETSANGVSVKVKENSGVVVDSVGVQLDASFETWTFTLQDSTTVTKKIAVFN